MAKRKSAPSKMPAMLTLEQQRVLDEVIQGKNILVDAVIGSGKTTLLESIYNILSDKRILYLTYNRLLKEEAQSRLKKRPGSVIQNFHGFTYPYLLRAGISTSISQGLTAFCNARDNWIFRVEEFDLLLIDEYQDLDTEMARVLKVVKQDNLGIQIVAVGDMNQKIFDKTTLDASAFIREFIPNLNIRQLSTCFRINAEHASYLGHVWETEINGVNGLCDVQVISRNAAFEKMLELEPYQLLVVGPRASVTRSEIQNDLERQKPEVFNKATLYSDISDSSEKTCKNTNKAAVFCTYDKCKGMERDYVFVVDFDESNWNVRKNAGSRYGILKNIFCVAASRGKKGIYFVSNSSQVLDVMSKALKTSYGQMKKLRHSISDISDYKKKELVDQVLLTIGSEVVQKPEPPIEVTENDYFIELLPVIGHWLEADYFEAFNKYRQYNYIPRTKVKEEISRQLDIYFSAQCPGRGSFSELPDEVREEIFNKMPTEQYSLAAAAAATQQLRYFNQVDVEMIGQQAKEEIQERLGSKFNKAHQDLQLSVAYQFEGYNWKYELTGLIDALLEGIPYEFKFSSVLSEGAYIQLACYLLASGLPFGYLWNIRTNELVKIWIPDVKVFANAVYDMLDK